MDAIQAGVEIKLFAHSNKWHLCRDSDASCFVALDMGFIHDVKKIIAKMPSKRQTLFFSATMPPEISKMVKAILVNPVKVEITQVSYTVDRIKQSVYLVDKENKQNQSNHLLQDKSIASALIFTRI